MKRTNWITQKFTSNTSIQIRNVTSFTLLNAGNTPLKFRERVLEPQQFFLLEGDGSYSDIELNIEFEKGDNPCAILDYRSVLKC